MACVVSSKLLEKRILILRSELEDKIGSDIRNLSCPEVLKINSEIDRLLVSYLKITMNH